MPTSSDDEVRAGQAANLLGALSLAVADGMAEAVTAAAGGSENDAVALSALLQIVEAPRIDRLAQVLGLTSSGTVRLVDRLERERLVRRFDGEDARATTVSLTAAGRRRARAVSAARTASLDAALAALTPAERSAFGALAGKLLAARIRPDPATRRWLCRLCDVGACGRRDGHCPVATAVQRRLAG